MALTKVSGGILDPGINVAGIVTATGFDGPFTGGSGSNITAGIITCTELDLNGNGNISGNLIIEGNLTANGDFTTLNTTLREVEILRVDADTTAVAGIITQRGSGDIFSAHDTSTEVFKIADGGKIGINTTDASHLLTVFAQSGNSVLARFKALNGISNFDISTDGTSNGQVYLRNNIGAVKVKLDSVGDSYFTGGDVGIGTDNPNMDLHVLSTSDDVARFQSTATGNGSAITLDHIGGSPADNDIAGKVVFNGQDDALNSTTYADIRCITSDVSNGSETAHLDFSTRALNAYNPILRLSARSTASAPSYTTDDMNGIILDTYNGGGGSGYERYFSFIAKSAGDTASNIAFWTEAVGGSPTEKLRITSAGQVQINTDGGSGALTLGASQDFKLYHDANGPTIFSDNNNQGLKLQIKELNLTEYTGTTSRLKILSNGNVEVKASGADQKRSIKIEGTNGSSELQGVVLESDGENAKFHIKTNAGGGTPANKLTIKAISGEVGIGTDNPGQKLHVEGGSIRIRGTGSNETNGQLDFGDDFRILKYTDENTMTLQSPKSVVINIDNNNNNTDAYFQIKKDTTNPESAGTELFKVQEDGNVSIPEGEIATAQDYPNFRPTLDFNFVAEKKLDPRITYSRTGPASFVDEFSKVILVGDNAPRFDHDPTTRECKGLLIEHQRTNQWLYSEDLVTYVASGEMQQSTLANTTATTDPTGGTDAVKMAATATGGAHSFYKLFGSGSNGNNHTASVWVKAAGVDYARIYVDTVGGNMGGPGVTFSTGNTWNVSASGTATQVRTSVVEYPNGWWRLSVTGNFSNQNQYYVHIDLEGGEGDVGFTGNASDGMYVWGVQFELGSFPSSYIPTNGSTATRGADFTTLLGDDFTDAINQTEGTLVAEYDNVTSDGYVLSLDGSGGDKIGMVNSNSYQLMGTAGGSSQGTTDNGTLLSGTNRFVLAYKLNDTGISINGNTATVDTSYTLPTTTFMSIGHRQYQYDQLGSCIARIMYYNTRLPNSQLKTLSTR